MELPVTYDDWEDMLTLFKEKYGCEQPYYIILRWILNVFTGILWWIWGYSIHAEKWGCD